MRDNNKIYRFKRIGLGRFDWSDDLPVLLNKKVLTRLINNNGYLILYIHLGDRCTAKDNLPLSRQSCNTLKNIAKLYHSGTLWITSTSRLLKYNLLMKILDWNVKENSQSIKIFIKRASSQRKDYNLSENDLAGLTFYIPDNKKVELFFMNKQINFHKNPMDKRGISSISIPLSTIEWPL